MTVGLSAFRYDTESFIIQQQEILRIVNELKDLVSKETLTDKDEVGILRDQIDNLRTCIFEDKSTSESARDILEGSEMSNYHSQKPNSDDVFYVNRNFASFPNARGIWYQDLRNTLLSFIEQQFHLSRLRSAVMASSTKNIGVNLSNLNASKMEFSNSNKDAETDFTPLSPNSLADMMQSLLGDEKSESNGDTGTIRKTFDARCEDPESKISNNRFRNHYDDPMLFGSLSELVNLVQDPLSRIMETFEIKVQSPSVVLVDSTGRSAAILLTSREASISIGSVGLCSSADGKTAEDLTDKSTIKVVGVVDFNSENDYSEHTIAGKRIKVIIDAAQLEVGSALTVMDRTEKDFVRVASDPKLSQKKSEDESHVIANNLNLAIVCDMDYTENHKRDPSSLKTRQSSQSHTISKATVYSIFSGGAKIHIATKNGISLCTDSEEYATLFDVIVNLLVYDDEIKACRKAKLESLMFLATISDPNRLKRTVESMQKKLLMTLLKFNRMAKRQLRTVKSDTKFFKECHVSDNNNRFNFEVIDECNISGQAEKLWRKISDRWDELGLVIAALRSASTAAASRLTGNKKEKTLLDASIPFLNWTISMPAEKMSKFSKSNSKTDIKEAKSMGTMASGNTVPAFEIKVQGFRDIFISSADSSTTNLIEIESFRGMNLIPTSFYRIFAEPISNRRGNQNILDTIMTKTYQQDCVLRVYMRSLPPVAGIRIFEQLEINVSPLRIQLNHDMGLQLLKFFLPRSSATIAKDPNEKSPKSLNLSLMTSNSSVKISDRNQNNNYDSTLDAEFTNLFRQRAAENCSFLYVRFPASYHVLSFKGEGGGKLIDIENFSLKIPDFRYNALVMSPRKLAMKILWDAVGPIAGNVGALIRDKIQRIGKQMKPDSSAIEENDDQEVLLEVAPVVKDETQEDRDRKAWLLLGKSFSKNKN